MLSDFWTEFLSNTSPCGHHYRHGECLIRCKLLEPDTFKIIKLISFNPFDANKTVRFICALADKHKVKIVGIAEPTIVGPSVTKNNTVLIGMNLERLLKWYAIYGFEHSEQDGKFFIKREPK